MAKFRPLKESKCALLTARSTTPAAFSQINQKIFTSFYHYLTIFSLDPMTMTFPQSLSDQYFKVNPVGYSPEELNAFQAAGECRRHIKKVHKFCKKCQNSGISWPYLEPPREMHSNKYKHAWYWFINSWIRH